MVYRIFFSEDAKCDIYRAKCQYDLAQKGRVFLDDIFNNLEVVKLMPEAFEMRYNSVRIVALEHFRFSIHYQIEKDMIKIFGIIHQSQSS